MAMGFSSIGLESDAVKLFDVTDLGVKVAKLDVIEGEKGANLENTNFTSLVNGYEAVRLM